MDRFITTIGSDDGYEQKNNLIEKKYSFGYAYKYWKGYSSNAWYINPFPTTILQKKMVLISFLFVYHLYMN